MSTWTPSGLTIAVVDGDGRVRAHLIRLLKPSTEPVGFASLLAWEEKIDADEPSVVIVGPSYADEPGLREIRDMGDRRPNAVVVMVVDDLSVSLLQSAMQAGVRDVVRDPRTTDDLLAAVRRSAQPRPRRIGGDPAGGRAPKGRVITVFSTKGGAGRSVVAANLAVALARDTQGPVAVLDADLQFGDQALMFGLTPRRTIVDAIRIIRQLDPETLSDLLLRHEASGVLVLAAPLEPAFADQVAADDVLRIVSLLRTFCSHVIVDTPAQLNDVVLGLIEATDDILMITGIDVPNVKDATLALRTMRLLDIPMEKVTLLINQPNPRDGVDAATAEKALSLDVADAISADPAVLRSVNSGVPVVLQSPKSAAAKDFGRLARRFAGALAAK